MKATGLSVAEIFPDAGTLKSFNLATALLALPTGWRQPPETAARNCRLKLPSETVPAQGRAGSSQTRYRPPSCRLTERKVVT
jgi:hypothetical protein